MELTSEEVLQLLMKWRTRVSAAAWTVVRDVHAAEDIFQNVALKAMTKDVRFESEAALLSWAFVVARREGSIGSGAASARPWASTTSSSVCSTRDGVRRGRIRRA